MGKRFLAVAVAACLLIAACTSDEDGDDAAPANDRSPAGAPIAVPVGLLGDGLASSGAARCIFADLRSVALPPNPGYVGESVGGQTIGGDELWAVMTDPEFRCIFAAATLGAEADHRVDVIIFYGTSC